MLVYSDTCSVEQTWLYKTHYVTSLQNVAMFGYVNKKFIVIGYYIVKEFNDKSTSNYELSNSSSNINEASTT